MVTVKLRDLKLNQLNKKNKISSLELFLFVFSERSFRAFSILFSLKRLICFSFNAAFVIVFLGRSFGLYLILGELFLRHP